jgi:hypothetical protein
LTAVAFITGHGAFGNAQTTAYALVTLAASDAVIDFETPTGGEVLYTPNDEFSGNDVFTWRIRDSAGIPSLTANFVISVSDPPTPEAFTNGYLKRAQYRMPMASIQGAATYNSFRMPFDITHADLKHVDEGGVVESALGWDIRFQNQTSDNALAHKLTSYDPVEGRVVGVFISIARYNADTARYMYIGKAGLTATEENPTFVDSVVASAAQLAAEAAAAVDPALFAGFGGFDSADTNQSPVAIPTRVAVAHGATLDIDVLPLCHEPDGDSMSLTAATNGTYGAGSISSQKVRYVHDDDTLPEGGVDTITYTLSDGSKTSIGKIEITVAEPVIEPDPPTGFTRVPTSSPIEILNTRGAGFTIATLTLTGGTGSGTWAIEGGSWAKATLSATTGSQVFVQTTEALSAGDNGEETIFVTYDNDNLEDPLPMTIPVEIVDESTPEPLTVTVLDSKQATHSAVLITSNSITPAPDSLLQIICRSRHSADHTHTSVTHTWGAAVPAFARVATQMATGTTNRIRTSVWQAKVTGTVPAGTVATNISVQAFQRSLTVLQSAGYKTATPIPTAPTPATKGIGTTQSITFATAPLADSAVISAMSQLGDNTGISPTSGFTELEDVSVGANLFSLQTQYRNGGAGTTVSHAGLNNGPGTLIAWEVQKGEGGGGVDPPTGIDRVPTTSPIEIATDAAINSVVATLTLVGGVGDGDWELTGPLGNPTTKFHLSAATGSSVQVLKTEAVTDVDDYIVIATYDGEGIPDPLPMTINISVLADEPEPPASASFDLGPLYTTNWELRQNDGPIGSIDQHATGVTMTPGSEQTDSGIPSQHITLISKAAFTGDFEVEFDITRLDNADGSDQQESGLFYFMMRGVGGEYPADITQWPDTKGFTRFELHASGYRMSFDPRGTDNNNEAQIRLRSFEGNNDGNGTQILLTDPPNTKPGQFNFVRNTKYHCRVIRWGREFFFARRLADALPTTEIVIRKIHNDMALYQTGRFIFRPMAGRIFKIENFTCRMAEMPPYHRLIRTTNWTDFSTVGESGAITPAWIVHNPSARTGSLRAGDRVVLTSGTHPPETETSTTRGQIVVGANGTADEPIVFAAESLADASGNGGTKLRFPGKFLLNGNHIWLWGFHFKDYLNFGANQNGGGRTDMVYLNGDHGRVRRLWFDNYVSPGGISATNYIGGGDPIEAQGQTPIIEYCTFAPRPFDAANFQIGSCRGVNMTGRGGGIVRRCLLENFRSPGLTDAHKTRSINYYMANVHGKPGYYLKPDESSHEATKINQEYRFFRFLAIYVGGSTPVNARTFFDYLIEDVVIRNCSIPGSRAFIEAKASNSTLRRVRWLDTGMSNVKGDIRWPRSGLGCIIQDCNFESGGKIERYAGTLDGKPITNAYGTINGISKIIGTRTAGGSSGVTYRAGQGDGMDSITEKQAACEWIETSDCDFHKIILGDREGLEINVAPDFYTLHRAKNLRFYGCKVRGVLKTNSSDFLSAAGVSGTALNYETSTLVVATLSNKPTGTPTTITAAEVGYHAGLT